MNSSVVSASCQPESIAKHEKTIGFGKRTPSIPACNSNSSLKNRQYIPCAWPIGWRALGVKEGQRMIWFWVGSHADYDNILNQY
jgi:hypothetical protein